MEELKAFDEVDADSDGAIAQVEYKAFQDLNKG